MSSSHHWLTTCPKGLESLLAAELVALGAEDVRETVAAVSFSGSLTVGYQVCLWSRLANRLLLPLVRREIDTPDQLYETAKGIEWEQHFSSHASFAIDFVGTSRSIDHTTFGAQRIKDGIVDRFREIDGNRPNVDLALPDIRIQARLHKGYVTISLDLAGESLHRRGYRSGQGNAPLKENLAAALLLRSGWAERAAAGEALLDPMCGSGTLLIEGAMIAADIAPGTLRASHRYGFLAWQHHQPELWRRLLDEALERRRVGMEGLDLNITGYDSNPRMVDYAIENIVNAGLDEHIRIALKPIDQFGKPTAERGLLLTNPPYGARIGEQETLVPLYEKLGLVLQKNFAGWRAAIFTGNLELARKLDLAPSKQYKFYNGSIECKLLLFDDLTSKSAAIAERLKTAPPRQEISPGAQMLLNRLRKNHRRLKSWLEQSGVSCYRLYDRDLPEYAVAIDYYRLEQGGDVLHVQEYAPPATIDAGQARRNFEDVRAAVKAYLPNSQRFYKERAQQKGSDQYQKLGSANSKQLVVQEGPARLEVNFTDYLDTGLFLDHRPVRKMIGELAAGKRFLNLFSYTSAASIHAALGGAEKTLSIDLSNTYLDWSRRNFELNDLDERDNPLMRANVQEWLERGIGEFDLIFLDPPTFSNSKKMAGSLDIQRDHAELIRAAMSKLAPGGLLIFSNNFRKFKIDTELADSYSVMEISEATFDPDFSRDARLHNVWRIEHIGQPFSAAIARDPYAASRGGAPQSARHEPRRNDSRKDGHRSPYGSRGSKTEERSRTDAPYGNRDSKPGERGRKQDGPQQRASRSAADIWTRK